MTQEQTLTRPVFLVVPRSSPRRARRGPARELDGASGSRPARAKREALFLELLPFIDRAVASIARRNALPPWDADDFGGQVNLRLIADDYAILGKFEGRSRLTTYLTTVIQNIYRDFRIQRWGKWRPSAAAKRLGEPGVQLEALLYRDGFGCSEAFAILRDRSDIAQSDDELEAIASQLRARTTRRLESDASLARLASPERGDRRAIDSDRSRTARRARRALRRALEGLDPEDRLILKLRFADSLTIRAIASSLGVRQRSMYTRVQRLLTEVRRQLEEEGMNGEEVLDLLGWPACNLEAVLDRPRSD